MECDSIVSVYPIVSDSVIEAFPITADSIIVQGSVGPVGPQGPQGPVGPVVPLGDLEDVALTSLADGHGLFRQGSEWINLPAYTRAQLDDYIGSVGDIAEDAQADITNHSADLDNPHGTTAAQVGAAPTVHTHAAADITSGQLSRARGGTGVDLTATGGAGQVLKQSTAGGAITVGLLAIADVTSLQAALDGKASSGDLDTAEAEITALQADIAALDSALSTHSHPLYTGGQDLPYANPASALQALGGDILRKRLHLWEATGTTTVPGALGMAALAVAGTASVFAAAPSVTPRNLRWTTASTAGSVAYWRQAALTLSLAATSVTGHYRTIGGFHSTALFVMGPTANGRGFVGLRNSVANPVNDDPAAYINSIGLAALPGQANYKLIASGSSAQTPIDTGIPVAGHIVLLELISDVYDGANPSVIVRVKARPWASSGPPLTYETTITGGAALLPNPLAAPGALAWRGSCTNNTGTGTVNVVLFRLAGWDYGPYEDFFG